MLLKLIHSVKKNLVAVMAVLERSTLLSIAIPFSVKASGNLRFQVGTFKITEILFLRELKHKIFGEAFTARSLSIVTHGYQSLIQIIHSM